MGGFTRVEDRPTPKEVYNWRVYMLALACGFGALAFGYDQAFVGATVWQWLTDRSAPLSPVHLSSSTWVWTR